MKKLIWCFLVIAWLTGCEQKEKEVMMEVPFDTYMTPAIDRNDLFITVNRTPGDIDNVNALIHYNIKSGDKKTLYMSEFGEASVQGTQVNKEWVVWSDASVDGIHQKILVMNRNTQEVRELAEKDSENFYILSPVLYEDYVAWTDINEDNTFEVRLHNLKENETKSIAAFRDFSMLNTSVYMGEDHLLWTDTKDEKGYYFLYNLNTQETQSYESQKPYPGYATYGNGNIFAIHFLTGDSWVDQDFGFFNTKTNEYHSMINNDYINYFDTFEDQLAILDKNNQLSYYTVKNDEWIPRELSIPEDPTPLYMRFDKEGNLLLHYDTSHTNSKPQIGIIYPE